MKIPSRKFMSISFAVFTGIVVIFFAWRAVSVTNNPVSEGVAAGEMNADGSWRDALKVIPQESLTRLIGAQIRTASNTAVFATTSTDVLGRELLTSYALAQQSVGMTPVGDDTTSVISDMLSKKMMTDVTLKGYTTKDLIVVPASTSTIVSYVTKLSQASLEFSKKNTVNELSIVTQAMTSKDPETLKPLQDVVNNLNKHLKSLLSIPVPQDIASFHLILVQSYATVVSGIEDMQEIIADPARGLRGIAKYQKGMNALTELGNLLGGQSSDSQ